MRVCESGILDPLSIRNNPSHGAPRYELVLKTPFEHPWRRTESYRCVQLVYRQGGHWTIGPPFDTNSGVLGAKLLNRGWIRTARPAAAGALPDRGAQWSYLSKPRFGRLGLHGKLELVPYIIERAMWLNCGRYFTEEGLYLDDASSSSSFVEEEVRGTVPL